MAFHPATAIAAPGHALGLASGAWPFAARLIRIKGCTEMAARDEIADRCGRAAGKEASDPSQQRDHVRSCHCHPTGRWLWASLPPMGELID
jgi:hypothetical protein